MIERQQRLNEVLEQIARDLDIPPYKYKEAMERFDAIKRHLQKGSYPRSTSPPTVYLQGSFRYGTVVRPLRDGKEAGYDIDMVCEVIRRKEYDDPKSLKDDVGAEVKGYAAQTGLGKPKNKRRCWVLDYEPDTDGISVHVDIIPSVPDGANGLATTRRNMGQGSAGPRYADTAIAITNRDDGEIPPQYSWRSSNPNAYARWFTEICQTGYVRDIARSQKRILFESSRGRQGFYQREEDIPDELVRTPLQRAIQIMKRHRDLRFSNRRDEIHKPIAIIVTTLAARLYQGRAAELTTTRSTLQYLVDRLSEHVGLVEGNPLREDVATMRLIQRVGDTWYIPNPVNPHSPGDPADKGENFADRWHEDDHAKARAFFRWVAWLRQDIDDLLNGDSAALMESALKKSFGNQAAVNVLRRLNPPSVPPGGKSLLQRAAQAALSFFNVPHREKPLWEMRPTEIVQIRGYYTRKGFRPQEFRSDGDALSKHYSLTFEATVRNVDRPFKVYWQVVNTGDEAQAAGGLRGGFYDGLTERGGLTRNESTLYNGRHWIQCFIVKQGVCVARSEEFVVNIY